MVASKISQFNVSEFETSNIKKSYLVTYNNRHFQVSYAVAELIEILKKSKSIVEAAILYSNQKKEYYSEADMNMLISRFIAPILKEQVQKPPSQFLFNIDLIEAKSIINIVNVLKYLFKLWFLIPLFLGILSLETIFFIESRTWFSIHDISLSMMVYICVLFVISSLFHELGHAAACCFFKIEYGKIGLGFYYNFPVFYTDVSNIWRLSRFKRLIVNLGGAYFQLILLIPFLIIYFVTYNEIVKNFIYAININLLFTLNPFFKFDGYWILSDLLGVPNLRQKVIEIFIYSFKRMRGVVVSQNYFLSEIKRPLKIILIVYSVLMNFVFGYYFCYLFPKLLISFCLDLPTLLKEIVEKISLGITPSSSLLQSVIIQFIFIGIAISIFYRIISRFVKKYNVLKSKQWRIG